MTKEEFNLIKEREELRYMLIRDIKDKTLINDIFALIYGQDKEFIRLLKEELTKMRIDHDKRYANMGELYEEDIFMLIDKLAGSELVEDD